jgi:hypothetical protein
MLLLACALAPALARAQATAPAQTQEPVPAKPPLPATPAAPSAPADAPPAATDAHGVKTPAATQPAATAPAATPAAQQQPAGAPVAQASSDNGAAQPPVTPAPPPSSPQTTSESTAQPPVPATEGTATEGAQAEAEKPTLPWSAALIWRQGYVVAGFDRGVGQSFNPTYTWTFLGLFGYRFDKNTSLSVFQPVTIELTDSQTTNTRQELWVLDTILDLSHTFYEMQPVTDQTFKFSAGVGGLLPLSKTSQAESMYFAPRVRSGVEYDFKHVLHGLGLSADATYMRRLLGSNVIAAQGPYSCATVNESLSHPCTSLDSAPSTVDEILFITAADLSISSKWRAGMQLWFYWDHSESFGTVTFTEASGGINPLKLTDTSPTHWHNSRLFTFSLGYAFTDWFTAGARLTNSFGERSPNSNLRAPFNPLDTVVGIDMSVSFDKLYMSTRGHGGS